MEEVDNGTRSVNLYKEFLAPLELSLGNTLETSPVAKHALVAEKGWQLAFAWVVTALALATEVPYLATRELEFMTDMVLYANK
jgi:uncharacterized membrane protein